MAGRRTKVFISSSMGELEDERGVIHAAIREMKLMPYAYEKDQVAAAAGPEEAWERDLKAADICVGILWRKAGDWTKREIKYAITHHIPILMFVKVEDTDADGDEEPASEEVREFLAPLTDPGTGVFAPKWFREAAELKTFVTEAILDQQVQAQQEARAARINAKEAVKGGGREMEDSEHGGVVTEASRIDVEPRPAAAVPRLKRYKGPFVGRGRTLERFSRLVEQRQQFIPITGADGMGRKTLLEVAAAEEWNEFPQGVGVRPEQSADEGVEDLLQAIWEAFYDKDELGVDVRRRERDLARLNALIVLLDVQLDDAQIKTLETALENSIIAATMPEDVETEMRRLSLGPLTEPDDLLTIFEEQAMVDVPDGLRDRVVAVCTGTGGSPAQVVALGNEAFNADVDESSLGGWLDSVGVS